MVRVLGGSVIGIIGGFVYLGASALMPKIKVDDPVEAFPVHGASAQRGVAEDAIPVSVRRSSTGVAGVGRCGIWGVLAAAIFDFGNFMDGPVHAWNGFSPYEKGGFGDLMLAQVVGVIAIVAWTGAWLTMVRHGNSAPDTA